MPSPPITLHGHANHCPDQAVGACEAPTRSIGLWPATGPVEDCRRLQPSNGLQGGSKRDRCGDGSSAQLRKRLNMLWANTSDGKATATPRAQGVCPICGALLIPKCGSIVSWHWAHKASDCDHWGEPESQWHIDWKQQFPKDWQEVAMGPHRADVATANGVIEFQKSSISADDIQERERFYGKMIWVIWAADWRLTDHLAWHYKNSSDLLASKKTDLFDLLDPNHKEALDLAWLRQSKKPHYRWSPPKKSWFAARKPMFLDFGGDHLERIRRFYINGPPYYLACERILKEELIKRWTAHLAAA